MRHAMIRLVRLYQKYLSPLKGKRTCIYFPCCSEYAVEAYQRHGFFKGSLLTVWRLLRCNPFHKGGVDPVPD